MGPWFNQDHRLSGYFTTVWQRTPAGWRWVYDGGVPSPKSSGGMTPKSERASCTIPLEALPIPTSSMPKSAQSSTKAQDNGRGRSADKTLGWDWKVAPSGQRTFRVYLWNGKHFAEVIHAIDPATKAK
jgi:hypothetical protein